MLWVTMRPASRNQTLDLIGYEKKFSV